MGRTTSCPSSSVEEAWRQTVAKSAFSFLPSLPTLGISAWSVMLLQLIFSLLLGVPRKKREFSVAMRGDLAGSNRVSTLAGIQSITDAMFALAGACRMNVLAFRFQAFLFEERSVVWWARKSTFPENRRSLANHLLKESLRMACFVLLESSVQPNLQVTVLAVISTDTTSASCKRRGLSVPSRS